MVIFDTVVILDCFIYPFYIWENMSFLFVFLYMVTRLEKLTTIRFVVNQ